MSSKEFPLIGNVKRAHGASLFLLSTWTELLRFQLEDFLICSGTKMRSGKTKRDTWLVSGKQSCLLSELTDRWCVLRWKSCGWKRWEHAGEQCHTPPCPLELDGDMRESVWISCRRD